MKYYVYPQLVSGEETYSFPTLSAAKSAISQDALSHPDGTTGHIIRKDRFGTEDKRWDWKIEHRKAVFGK